jgi:3-oxoacyl-[acyl-carrier protein] reductase
LVTGASRGIGCAIALQLAKDGFDIVINYLSNEVEAKKTQREIEALGRNARLLPFDIANRTQVKNSIDQDIEKYGAYYGIVCNAGITHDTAFPAMQEHEWDEVIHTNLDGFYNVIQPLIMPMIQMRQGGRIVTISSVSGIVGNRGQVNYSASKAGLIGATKALAIELGKRQITVNCVAPGVIETDMTNYLDDKLLKEIIPLRRKGKVDEVAATVAFLFSEGAAYITRQVISVNGGMV